ncbi:MAG: hypothetical protein FJX72_16190, partial [Armatimonadetes bacterium]|nr:hypothetical protein [Armatimonadota bacterium]
MNTSRAVGAACAAITLVCASGLLLAASEPGAASDRLPYTQSRALKEMDLTEAAAVASWQPTHDVAGIEASPEGMVIRINGGDPYITGPVLGIRSDSPLWLRMRVRSDVGGTMQAFYFEDYPTEARASHAPTPQRKWTEIAMALPPLKPGTRIRLDPPGTSGACTVAWIRVSERKVHPMPRWTKPAPISPTGRLTVRSGNVALSHAPRLPGAFDISVGGYSMATGWSRLPLCYTVGDTTKWTDLAERGKTAVAKRGNVLEAVTTATDPDGARWIVRQTYSPGRMPGVLNVGVRVSVNKDRIVSFLPMVAMFPGVASFGSARERGLLAGLEYLDRPDRSSSEDDLRGEQAQRLAPDFTKVTFPLMAIQAAKRYVGLIWDHKSWLTAAYDTPDRSFGSRANAMAILFPGSDGVNRSEGSLLPYEGRLLEAGYPLTVTGHIIGGSAGGVVPAIERYVALRGLPPVPATGMNRTSYARWAAGAWLDSRISEGARYRHAYWPNFAGFAPLPAADPATWMEWLAVCCNDPALARRLRSKAQECLNITDPATRNSATVSHVTYPVQTLLFGEPLAGASHADRTARAHAAQFGPDGLVAYGAASGATDYGSTHFEKHANGHTGAAVVAVLTNALVSGEAGLLDAALKRLRGLDRS